MSEGLATVSYIGATIPFVLSLGGLSNPETARRGNLYGMIGMAVAVPAPSWPTSGLPSRLAMWPETKTSWPVRTKGT